MSDCKAIGIDLGTTYCCVAVFIDGKAEVIANDQGHRTTPSYVWFSENDRYIGDEAKKKSGKHPQQTVYGIKRLMGRKFDDIEVQMDIRNWPFAVIAENGLTMNERNVPKVQVEYKGEIKNFSPEEISAMFLAKMKKTAEDYLDCTVTEAVITVPAYFNDAQRTATFTAGRIVGLEVLRIINEPTAAALAYAIEGKLGTSRTILVFDFGGGTLDVSIISGNNGTVDVKAVDGDNHLGGEDIDHNLMQHVIEECKRKLNVDIHTNARADLKSKCEQAKLSLSAVSTVEITLDGLNDGKSFNMVLSRARFDEINKDIFDKALEPVKRVLIAANMEPDDIDRVLLVGGSSRIPKIKQMLQEMFNQQKIINAINPDEAVACGAAVQAAKIKKDPSLPIRKVVLSDVIPLSLGVAIKGDMMSRVIKRNSKIPIINSQRYVTSEDNQTCINFRVLEGERLMAADNNLLGHFVLNGLPKARKGAVTALVTFEVDDNGILTVSAVEEKTGNKTKYNVTSDRQMIPPEEINRMIQEAEQFKLDDEILKQCALFKNEFEDYIYKIQNALQGNPKAKISSADKTTVSLLCDDTLKWIKDNPKSGILELKLKKRKLENIWDPILKKSNIK